MCESVRDFEGFIKTFIIKNIYGKKENIKKVNEISNVPSKAKGYKVRTQNGRSNEKKSNYNEIIIDERNL